MLTTIGSFRKSALRSDRIRRALFSQYAYSGVQAAAGVAGVALLVHHWLGIDAALVSAIGANCVSIADRPSPTPHKLVETLAAAVFSSAAALIVGLSRPSPWATGIAVLGLGFFSGMLNAYGNRAMPVAAAVLLAVVVTLGSPMQGLPHDLDRVVLFAAGSALYIPYALAVSFVLAFRTKQQAVAECIFALAGYAGARARFFDQGADLDACYSILIERQAAVMDALQNARDFALRRIRTSRDARLARTLLAALDVYERLLSSHADYALLQRRFGDSDIATGLRDLLQKGRRDLERFAESVLRNRRPFRPIDCAAELAAIEHALARLERQAGGLAQQDHALQALKEVCQRVAHAVRRIEALHTIATAPAGPDDVVGGADLTPFLTPVSVSPRVLLRQLRPDSPTFRFALRLALALGVALAVSRLLPYAAYGYWIILTVAVVMRSSFSLTKQRRTDRILGTLAGCVLAAVLLRLPLPIGFQLAAFFLALAIGHAFVTIQYRYASAAVCLMALLQIHFLDLAVGFPIVERLADTVAGAALAFAFSFVLPSWEYARIPNRVVKLLRAHARFVEAVFDPSTIDFDFRVARKQLLDSIANLSGAFRRMLDEPTSRHRAVSEVSDFIALSYEFAAQVTALRAQLRCRTDRVGGLPTDASLAEAAGRTMQLLASGAASFRGGSGSDVVEAPPPGKSGRFSDSACLAAGGLTDDRLAAIEQAADELRRSAAALARHWPRAPDR